MRIKLNRNLYCIEAVQKAIEDFKEVCDCKVLNDSIEIELVPKENIENLEKEFYNYVLGLMKEKL
jgi:hypothetical protein